MPSQLKVQAIEREYATDAQHGHRFRVIRKHERSTSVRSPLQALLAKRHLPVSDIQSGIGFNRIELIDAIKVGTEFNGSRSALAMAWAVDGL